MHLATLLLLGFVLAQSATLPPLTIPRTSDLTITTRRSSGQANASTTTEILYVQGSRQRAETIVDWPPGVSAASGATSTHVRTSITQCDERRTLTLNDQARTYAYASVDDPSAYLKRFRLAASPRPQPRGAGGADVAVTIDAVDTGERRPIGTYVARHIVTTVTVAPGPGAHTLASTRRRDGWYVDLPSPTCRAHRGPSDAIAYGFVVGATTQPDRVHVRQVGLAYRGYPLEETTTLSETDHATATSRLELVDVSNAPLDPALFAVPPGYRPALPGLFGGHDLTKPDTLANRAQAYWAELVAWTNRIFR